MSPEPSQVPSLAAGGQGGREQRRGCRQRDSGRRGSIPHPHALGFPQILGAKTQ